MADASEPVIGLLGKEWGALAALASDFTDADWSVRTDLPAWDVKDCYAHVAGTERVIQGLPVPEVDLSGLDLSAPSALFTEPPVASRRHLTGAEVLAEVVAVTGERLAELRALDPDDWDFVGPTPLGEIAYREFMQIRVFDCWMHEQDVRRALDRPGHVDGPVVELALGRTARAVAAVIGKKVAPPDGTVVELDVTGALARTLTFAVQDGRAALVTAGAGSPTARLSLDQETLWCLGGGRWHPDRALADGRIAMNGDHSLGERIVRALNFMI